MRVAVFSGPTGGHFYPALAFAQAFKKRHPDSEILFVTGERGRGLARRGGPLCPPLDGRPRGGAPTSSLSKEIQFEFLPDFPFPRPRDFSFLWKGFSFLGRLLQAFFKTSKILNDFQPEAAVGFGSYIAFPGILLCGWKKIPAVIHEQNRVMGRANAWLSYRAAKVALTFEKTQIAPAVEKTWRVRHDVPIVVTGLPLRNSLVEKSSLKGGEKNRDLSPPQCTLLVLGGSQGSESLNELWRQAYRLFSDEEKSGIAVIHITGERNVEKVQAMVLSEGVEAQVFPFFSEMEELYSKTDLALTRSGAGTLFELALFGLPAVVIPYPHADGHQQENARYFEERGALVQIPEKECTPERLRAQILALVHSPDLRNRLSENFRALAKPDAAEKLVDLTEELLALPSLRGHA